MFAYGPANKEQELVDLAIYLARECEKLWEDRNEARNLYDGGESHNMPIVWDITYKNRLFILPPPNTRLTDAVLYLVLKTDLMSPRSLSKRFPVDLNSDGDIHPDRIPLGEAVVV